jgi:hypothetical protein
MSRGNINYESYARKNRERSLTWKKNNRERHNAYQRQWSADKRAKIVKCSCGIVLVGPDGTLTEYGIPMSLGGNKIVICDNCSWSGVIIPWRKEFKK